MRLIATSAAGSDTLTRSNYITVIDCDTTDTTSTDTTSTDPIEISLLVPNAFSPNGDGENDVLFIKGSGIKDLTFSVYNRWGEKVFETINNNIVTLSGVEGWDGTHRGEKTAAGVYVYYLTGEFIDGEFFNKKGNITLIR